MAIQQFVLRPKSVLKITLKRSKNQNVLRKSRSQRSSNIEWTKEQQHIQENPVTNTAAVPIIMTGFRPYRSAIIPHKTDVRALPSINEEPSWNQQIIRTILDSQTELRGSLIDVSSLWQMWLTHITCVVTNFFFCFRNLEVPYLQENQSSYAEAYTVHVSLCNLITGYTEASNQMR